MTCDGCVCTMQIVCSGHGHCLGTQSSYCVCNLGYSGAACESCGKGYLAAVGRCIFAPGALASCTDGVHNGNEDGVDCGGSCGNKCMGGASGKRSHSVSCTVLAQLLSLPQGPFCAVVQNLYRTSTAGPIASLTTFSVHLAKSFSPWRLQNNAILTASLSPSPPPPLPFASVSSCRCPCV